MLPTISAGNIIAERNGDSKTIQRLYAHGSVDGTVTLNHENGHYQTLDNHATPLSNFTNFPASGSLGRIILDITVAPQRATGILTFPSAVIKADNVRE
jgi:hypothetical protein